MLLNAKLNDTDQKILWAEAVHMCKRVRNSMANTGSTTSPFKTFYGEKPKMIGLFSEFGRIGYVTKWGKVKKQMTDKKFKSIVVGHDDNNARDTYKLTNPVSNRVIMTRNVNWWDWKKTDPTDNVLSH